MIIKTSPVIYFLVVPFYIVFSLTTAHASDLSDCIKSYCKYSCGAVSTCGYLAKSGISSCKRSCKSSATRNINTLKKDKRLSRCQKNNRAVRKVTCAQFGAALGVGSGGGNGNSKRSHGFSSVGEMLGADF